MRSLALLYPELLVGTYYRRFVAGTRVPEKGGLVIYTNHSNGLIDGGMTLFLTKRPQSFLAKASLFRIPVLHWVIRSVGAIPIYRQKDQVDMSKNDDSFREVHRVLRQGRAMVIYPEGESRLGLALRPFKTGAARMVLGAEQGNPAAEPVLLQPVWVLYEEQETFLSRAHLWAGEPFDARAYLESYAHDEWETVRVLTAVMQTKLQDMALAVDRPSDFYDLVELDRMLATTPSGAPARWFRLAHQWKQIERETPTVAAALRHRIQTTSPRLERLGLEGFDLLGPSLERSIGRRILALCTLLLALPLALFWAVPIGAARGVATLGRSTPDKLVTVTVVGSSVLMPLWALGWIWSGIGPFGLGLRTLIVTLLAAAWLGLVRNAGRPRPLRRALTLLGLQGRRTEVDSLWKAKQELCQTWQSALKTSAPDAP